MSASGFKSLASGRKKLAAPAQIEQLQRLHDPFLAQWLQALRVLLPASAGLELVSLSEKSYGQFLSDCPPTLDIEVFEVQAWQSLCAWCFDGRWVSAAVDCLFGGGARLPVKGLGERRLTAIEVGVRKRLIDSLASAYESAWTGVHPMRLQSLRSEEQLANLRMAAAADTVVHLQLALKINTLDLQVHACLPVSCLQWLRPVDTAMTADPAAPAAAGEPVQGLIRAPVEMQAVLAHTELTVAQLMSLSVGQVIELQMHDPLPLRVRGVQIGTAQHGLRNGRYAVRIDSIKAQVNAQAGQDSPDSERISRQAQSLLSSIDLNLATPDSAKPSTSALDPEPRAGV